MNSEVNKNKTTCAHGNKHCTCNKEMEIVKQLLEKNIDLISDMEEHCDVLEDELDYSYSVLDELYDQNHLLENLLGMYKHEKSPNKAQQKTAKSHTMNISEDDLNNLLAGIIAGYLVEDQDE